LKGNNMTAKEERAAIYARCRSLSLEDYEITLEQQLDICYSYCSNSLYKVVEQYVCSDVGEGDPMLAPQLGRLRQAAAEGQIDVLVVATADRIDELPAWQVVVMSELEKFNVRVESALERHGTHLIMEQIIKDTDEAVAQIMRERTASSRNHKVRRNKGSRRS
jgi:DNA invertase Pin-like site-specific DNA recombinase